MDFKDALKKHREKAGLSQSQLATESDVSVRTIQNWEIGRNIPRIDAIIKLARAMGVSVDDLLAPKPVATPSTKRPRSRPKKAK